MEMLIGGGWRSSNQQIEVKQPLDGSLVDTVPQASAQDVEDALSTAATAAKEMAAMPAHARMAILRRAADLCDERVEEFAKTISAETGKPITEARGEASRMSELMRLAGYEGTNLRGETLPLDGMANPPAEDKIGFTLRHPCGVVVAITPFNFPALLVMHKVAPAIAAGNALILKPASSTPLSGLLIGKLLVDAGMPANAIQCITGSGGSIGDALCSDPRVRKISFTGSVEVGEHIASKAGVKHMSLELGANSPCIIMPDADIQKAAELSVVGGYVNAGQVCISMQRALVHSKVYSDYIDAMKDAVGKIAVGKPSDEKTKLSAMISEKEACRVHDWVQEAANDGAKVVAGGDRDGALMSPTLISDVKPQMRLFRDEAFGPVLSAMKFDSIGEAIDLCAVGGYGLAASIFTQDVSNAMHFVRAVDAGNVHVNWTPLWRSDMMPYGGTGKSGIGKEGVRSAVEAMTETKMVVIHDAKH